MARDLPGQGKRAGLISPLASCSGKDHNHGVSASEVDSSARGLGIADHGDQPTVIERCYSGRQYLWRHDLRSGRLHCWNPGGPAQCQSEWSSWGQEDADATIRSIPAHAWLSSNVSREQLACLIFTNFLHRIAGQNIANPVAMILCVALMFRYSLNMESEARRVEDSVRKVLDSGIRTPDLGGTMGTKEVGDAIVAAL